jgi:hypothetical protein
MSSVYWRLRRPSPGFRIPPHKSHRPRETWEEDARRLKELQGKHPENPATAALRAAVEGPQSFASAQAVVKLRERFGGQLMELHSNLAPETPAYVATLIPNYGEIGAAQLPAVNFRAFKERLRSQINRAHPLQIDGMLVAVLEGEYITPADKYRLHHHVYATGEMVDVIASLKPTEAYETRPRRCGRSA